MLDRSHKPKRFVWPFLLAALFSFAGVGIRHQCIGAVLTTLEYRIGGVELRVTPAVLSVPKGIAGSVFVELMGRTSAVPAGAFIEATFRGPSFPARRVIGQINAPLLLPLLGNHKLDGLSAFAAGLAAKARQHSALPDTQ